MNNFLARQGKITVKIEGAVSRECMLVAGEKALRKRGGRDKYLIGELFDRAALLVI